MKSEPRTVSWKSVMLLVTLFQLASFAPLLLRLDWEGLAAGAASQGGGLAALLTLLGFPAMEWLFLLLLRAVTKKQNLAPEILACWLSGLSLAVCGSISAEFAWKQAAAVAGGMLVYAAILWAVSHPDRAMRLRPAVAVAAGGLLALNLVLAQAVNGQRNWIALGGFSIQPSELVKLAFVFVGAATLEKLQRTPSITRYLIFAMGCVGALFLMKDFGTALLFFSTYIVIALLRSSDLRAIALVCAAAAMAAALVLLFRPYVMGRFRVYRHVWDDMHGAGYQQTRVLIYSSSGGLFGLGLGNGKLRNVFAASTDLVFGVLCEEFGMLIAFLAAFSYVALAVYTVLHARQARSAFYAIAAISASSMLLIQASLNIFGITDLLPLTGVTLPFISRGGTSMLCSWGLLAFISADSGRNQRLANCKPPVG